MATKRMPTGLVIRDRSIKIWFMYQGKRCWESLPLKPTTANIRHATKLREEICTRIAIGVFDYAEFFPNSKRAEETERSPTFREMAEAWLATVNQLSHSTLSRYRGMLNSHVLPKIGDMPIDRIQYSTLAGLLATLDCSAKTRNNIATVIRQPFVLALRDGRIKDNPAQHLANAKVQKEPPDPFTLEEAEAILGYLKNEPVFHNYFELAFFSGMRTSELIALTWQDIDFQRQCVRVNKASVAGKLKSTKTHSYRDIELNSRTLEALRRQWQRTGLASGYVFINPKTGSPFENDKVPWRPWQHAIKIAGVRYRKPYNTRHTFATLNLMAGANPMWVARQMGHSTMKMLLENYSRWIDLADKQREKSKIEQLFDGKCANSVPKNTEMEISIGYLSDILVEAGGIEPPSESPLQSVLHT